MMGTGFDRTHYDLANGLSLRLTDAVEVLRDLARHFSRLDPWARLGITAEGLARTLMQSTTGRLRFEIRVDQSLAGLIVVQPQWLCGPYVPFLGLLPEHQGCGVGSAVLAWFRGQAALLGQRNAWIAVSQFNHRARALYERAGYNVAAEMPDLVADGHTELLMRIRP